MDTLGTREVSIIPAGEIGNDNPLRVTREYWYAPQIGVNVLSKLQDPTFGSQTFEVVDIDLRDPDPTLFRPPAGSRIIDLRGKRVGMKHP